MLFIENKLINKVNTLIKYFTLLLLKKKVFYFLFTKK